MQQLEVFAFPKGKGSDRLSILLFMMDTGSSWNRKELMRIQELLSHEGESVAPSKTMAPYFCLAAGDAVD